MKPNASIDGGLLRHEERVSPAVRLFMASIAIAMFIAAAGSGYIVTSLRAGNPAQAAGIAIGAVATLAFILLGGFILRSAVLGERRSLCIDLHSREVLHTKHSLGRRPSEQRYPFSDIVDVSVKVHESDGAVPNYSVSLMTRSGAPVEWGQWYARNDAEVFAASLRKQLQ